MVFHILLRTFYFCDDPPLFHDLFIVSAKPVNTFRNNDISGFQFFNMDLILKMLGQSTYMNDWNSLWLQGK